MGLDLLALVFWLQRSFGVTVFRAVAGSPRLYDSAFDSPAVANKKSRTHASQEPWGEQDDVSSHGEISVLSGSPFTTWSSLPLIARSQTDYAIQLTPDSPVVVGRSHGHVPPYLDPAYRPTRIVPGTGQAVLHWGGYGRDMCVSRAHFMLLGVSRGILFVNGVPRRGGGIRPPLYGTRLVAPGGRDLSPGEEYLIESGTAMVVRLPNGTELRIDAN
jgi:hypothetical protein